MIDQTDPAARYTVVARSLHWLTVAMIVVQFSIAWTMPDVGPRTLPIGLIGWHLSVGIVILVVTIGRIVWRLTHRPPAPPSDLPPLIALVSRSTHWAMYVLLIALPMLGWVNANARGWAIKVFGIVGLPKVVMAGTPWAMQMGDVHGNLAILLLVAIALHVSGAAYHAFILRDRTVNSVV